MSRVWNEAGDAARRARKRVFWALGAAAAAAAVLSCATLRPEPGSEIVARVGEREITRSELEQAARGQLLRLEVDYKQSVYRNERQILDYLVHSELIEAGAERRGVTPTELMGAEVRGPAEEVSDEEIEELYERSSDRLEGGLEENRSKLRDYLVRQKRERLKVSLLQRLRDEAGVETSLPYPVLPTVEIAGGESAPSKGPADAPITIVEFSDFQCPFCKRMQSTLADLLDEYDGKVRLEYRHFPLRSHPVALAAAQASACADEQGKFWAYHDGLFEWQHELSEEKLSAIADSVGLDLEAYNQCIEEERYSDLVDADTAAGREAGIQGTPAFFVNGHPIYGAGSGSVFREVIDRELKAQES